MHFDLPLEELRTYRSTSPPPDDFDDFWEQTLSEARQRAQDPVVQQRDVGLRTVISYDVTFTGFAGDPIKGWYLHPKDADGPLPCVVEYVGYGGGRGFPTDWLLFPSCGYALLVMDNRGQGSSWQRGDTADPEAGAGPSFPGFLTQGIRQPQTAFYRRLYTDASLAVAAARALPGVDPSRIVLTGGSQGGALVLAAAALDGSVQGIMPDVPFLSDIRRAVALVDTYPYQEVVRYLRMHREQVDAVLASLDYFDTVHFAARCHNPAVFSVGLMDDVCPPSTVYAAFNSYAGPKQMHEFPFNEHEGGGTFHLQRKVAWLRSLFA